MRRFNFLAGFIRAVVICVSGYRRFNCSRNNVHLPGVAHRLESVASQGGGHTVTLDQRLRDLDCRVGRASLNHQLRVATCANVYPWLVSTIMNLHSENLHCGDLAKSEILVARAVHNLYKTTASDRDVPCE